MREIKFRAWDKEDRVMQYHLEFNTNELEKGENKFYNFMQFTGLRDRNWKDIYEGDIVNFFATSQEWEVSDIVCTGPAFAIRSTEGYTNLQDFIHEVVYSGNPVQPIEVLGNIYENSELMK